LETKFWPDARFRAEIARAPASAFRYLWPVGNSSNRPNIALIGFMGTGKSTVGQLVAEQLGFRFVDTDHLIEERAGKPITQIFQESGEAAFREVERRLLSEMSRWTRTVIATGGGLAAQPGNLEELKKSALVVCLWASPETIWERTRHQSHRPLLKAPDPAARIRELLAAREPYYRQADLLIRSDQRAARQVAQQIIHHYRELAQTPAAS
jgi:shikimate kinase